MSRWKKVLYEKNRRFEDNYVPASMFLKELTLNKGVVPFQFRALATHSAPIALELATATAFTLLFVEAYRGTFSDTVLLAVAAGLGGVALFLGDGGGLRSPGALVVLSGCLLALSPVLGTLTESVSDDTIWALSAALAVLHLVTFNYGQRTDPGPADAVSLNAAMFAAVLLGSRLPSTAQVFALLSTAVVLFGPFAALRLRLRRPAPGWFAAGTAAVCTAVGVAVAEVCGLRSPVTVGYTGALVFSSLVSPVWLIHLQQRLKRSINGPWDEAVADQKPT